MFLTTFSLWLVAVYSLRSASLGNSLSRYLVATPADLVRRADAATGHAPDETDDETLRFLRGFSHRVWLALFVLLLEVSLFVHLFWVDVLPWLALGLLTKDLVFAAIGAMTAGRVDAAQGLLLSMRGLPRGLLLLDRLGALLSGLGALAFFLVLAFR